MTLQTEFDFVLPKGFVDDNGNLQREGSMRMATALDEIAPLRDPRVRNNEAYLVVILLSQVITKLGTLPKHPLWWKGFSRRILLIYKICTARLTMSAPVR